MSKMHTIVRKFQKSSLLMSPAGLAAIGILAFSGWRLLKRRAAEKQVQRWASRLGTPWFLGLNPGKSVLGKVGTALGTAGAMAAARAAGRHLPGILVSPRVFVFAPQLHRNVH